MRENVRAAVGIGAVAARSSWMSRAVRPRNTIGSVITGPGTVKSGTSTLRSSASTRTFFSVSADMCSRTRPGRRVEFHDAGRARRAAGSRVTGPSNSFSPVADVASTATWSIALAGSLTVSDAASHENVTGRLARVAAGRPQPDAHRMPLGRRDGGREAVERVLRHHAPAAAWTAPSPWPLPLRCTPSSPCARAPRRPCA